MRSPNGPGIRLGGHTLFGLVGLPDFRVWLELNEQRSRTFIQLRDAEVLRIDVWRTVAHGELNDLSVASHRFPWRTSPSSSEINPAFRSAKVEARIAKYLRPHNVSTTLMCAKITISFEQQDPSDSQRSDLTSLWSSGTTLSPVSVISRD
jgi:hypothetical protein